ncbi:MAG: hypothetical protein IPK80_34800 [Nannocystis sp.]|nr:hypothetical protein [Nannocystis sp.]
MTVRDHLIDALRAELVGPYDTTGEELLRLAPSRTYLTGFIAPPELLAEAPEEDLDATDDFAAGSDTEDDDDHAPDPEPASKKVFPASVGLSVLLPREATEVTAHLRWGEYRRVLVDPDTHKELPPEEARAAAEGKGKSKRRPIVAWRRVAIAPQPTSIPLDPHTIARGLEVADRIWLQGRLADAGQGDGTQALSLFLVNRRIPDESNPREQTILFQVEYQLHCPAGILPRPDLTGGDDGADIDDKISDLQYRNSYEYAVGHGAAATPLFPASGHPPRPAHGPAPRAPAVALAWIPQAEFKPVAARTGAPVEISMQALGKLSSAADVEAALGGLPRAYESWIDAELARSDARASLSKNRLEILDLLITRARTAAHRIRAGIDLLAHDPEVRQAFVFANRAMFFQARQRARRAKAPGDDPQWRLFQLAFILLSLADIALPEGHEGARSHREDVELIFFPTGGGKTEAYLGLIAFTLLLRRLRGRHAPHGGEGVAVILRYTLRLLTLDQLERASTLICALETMRAGERYRALLGDRRFEIGLWVGSKASANRMLHFKEQLSAFRAGTGGNPCPLQLCPWCGEPLTSKSLTVETTPSGLERALVRCHNEPCDFAKAPHSGAGLPLQFVDEQIYRDLPCFLVATVDKFAMLPWRGETGMLFGRVTHREPQGGSYYGPTSAPTQIPRGTEALPGLLPPELIVQDELHLISGPLGTMVGLFETAIEELCTREHQGRRIPPKIIAATATVRRAERQVQALYGRRDTNIFPPQGLDPFETWFSLVEHTRPGRIYLGVGAGGRAMKRILLQTYLTLLGAARRAEQSGAPLDETDGYFTLVGYFNSLRELGGMRRLVEDDIGTRAPKQEEGKPLDAIGPHRWVAGRPIGFPQELTSREKTADIIKIKDRASTPHGGEERALDVLLASNMISVGVDISRLGVMVVAGQPKTTAEYIQASSRVGRAAKWPGLVLTAYNVYRPRDRSHYEHFVAYHESFYRHVEATSVTPFSAPAQDRGLAAVIVTLARLLEVDMTASREAMNAAGIQALSARILAAIHRKATQQPAVGEAGEAASDEFARSVQDRAENIIHGWLGMIRERKDGQHLHYSPFDTVRGRGRPLLRTALEVQRPDPESRSMLTEDEKRFAAPTSMRDVEPSVHVWRRFKLGSNQ